MLLLQSSQGDILFQTSRAVGTIVESICFDTLRHDGRVSIEGVDHCAISQFQKGDPRLLALLQIEGH